MDHSPLNELPAELRNSIYGLVFAAREGNSTLTVEKGFGSARVTFNDGTHHLLALTATCKQIRREAFSLLLSDSTLSIQFSCAWPGGLVNLERGLEIWQASFYRSRYSIVMSQLGARAWTSELVQWTKCVGSAMSHLRSIQVDLGHGFPFDKRLIWAKEMNKAPHLAGISVTLQTRYEYLWPVKTGYGPDGWSHWRIQEVEIDHNEDLNQIQDTFRAHRQHLHDTSDRDYVLNMCKRPPDLTVAWGRPLHDPSWDLAGVLRKIERYHRMLTRI